MRAPPPAGASAPRRAADPAMVVAALVLVGYFALARVVDNLYPFSTFSMYSAAQSDSGSRIVARDARGGVREVTELAAWSCDPGLDLAREPELCAALPRYESIAYIDRELAAHVLAHGPERAAGEPAGEEVTIVRRVLRFPAGPGPARVEDCELARCRATPR